jgi:hypothetical protein
MIEVKSKRIIETYSCEPNKNNFKETDFEIRHNTVKERVKSLLRKDKYARTNDFYLCLLYWISCGHITMNIDFKDWNKITKPESISRCRRQLLTMARRGDKELQFLLKDTKTLNDRDE